MRLFSNTTLMLILMLLLGPFVVEANAVQASHAQPSDGHPAYSRQRAGSWGGGGWQGRSQTPDRYAGYHRGYYSYQPAIAGSWYARPYPYHFDYYRQRYSAPALTNDCPCAKVQAEE